MPDVPAQAIGVIKEFFEAAQRKDVKGMEACLTKKCLESGQFNGEGPEGLRFEIGPTQMEGAAAVVTMLGIPQDAPAGTEPVMKMACLVVQEGGKWKFDIGATMERMMGGQLEAAMTQVAEGMGQAMDKIGQAIGDALGGVAASNQIASNVDPAWESASLRPEEDELFPLPEMTRLVKTTMRVTYAIGTDAPVDAAMADLLTQLHSDETNTLMTWFEDTLFAQWQPIFTGVVDSGLELRNRLRAVRIETATQCEDRLIVLDGSDLVYRVNLTNTDGYFSDATISALLPGVLAGLPERIDYNMADKRTLPLDADRPTPDDYRQRWVPRWMRRISALLGKPVGLEIDWARAAEANNVGPQLPRWGLNRVYGALALACLDGSRKEKLKKNLNTIEVLVGASATKRSARYEDGKLSIGLCYYGGDTPGCYEFEIAGALDGKPVE